MRQTPNWADVEVESDEELNSDFNSESSSAFVSVGASSQDFQRRELGASGSENGGYPASGDRRAPERKTKGLKLNNKALSKHESLSQHRGDESPSIDASSMSDTTSLTPRSGLGSTRSHRSTEDSGDAPSQQYGMYSAGSEKHDEGGCKPCLFVHTHVGCQNGAQCEFCHYVHKRKSKPRPCKGKRERYKKLLTRMGEAIDGSSDAGSGSASASFASPRSSHTGEPSTIAQI